MLKQSKQKSKERYLHTNIEFLLDKFNIDTKTLSIQTGVPAPTIVRLKKPQNNPTVSSVEPIADFFRVELHEFLYQDLSSEEYQSKQGLGPVKHVPVIHMGELKTWPLQFDRKLFAFASGNLHEGAFGIKIDATSLEPVFLKNSILIVDPQLSAKDSDYVLVTVDDDTTPVIRQVFIDGKNHFFKPLNPNYGDMTCAKKFKILGIVVKSIENFR